MLSVFGVSELAIRSTTASSQLFRNSFAQLQWSTTLGLDNAMDQNLASEEKTEPD